MPPEGVKQRSIFMNIEIAGLQFVPPEKLGLAVDRGRYPVCPITHPPTFWRSIVTGEPYRIKALWIVGSNPLVTMTHSLEIEEALRLLEFIVVSDFFLTPTAQYADLFLPAATWLEQDDVANLHKIWCVLARRQVAQIGETRDDRDVIIELARRLGLDEAFPWSDLREYFDWVLEDTGLDFDAFCDKGILAGGMRYRKYETEGFATPSGKLELASSVCEGMGVPALPVYREPSVSPMSTPELAREFPLILTTGSKARGFFHSEGRQIASLRRLNPDPLLEMNADTANSLGISDADDVWVETPEGRIKMKASLSDRLAADVVSAQHGWWFPESEPPEYGWKRASVNLLFGDTEYDPDSGSEPLRSTMCRVTRVGD